MINERKVADMVAYFLLKEQYGEMDYLKLIKLMYLSDREGFIRDNEPISCDDMASMEHGPVLVETLDLMEGIQPSKPNGWNSRINDLDDSYISVKEDVIDYDLDKLSAADREIMDDIWENVGHLSEEQLRQYIRRNCPEWKYPNGLDEGKYSPSFITVDSLCNALGFDKELTTEIKEYLDDAQDFIAAQNHGSYL